MNCNKLTETEQVTYFNALHDGNESALAVLFDNFAPLINMVCNRFKGMAEFDDMYAEGSIALSEAIRRFDVNFGTQFSTYAMNCISGTVKNYITKMNGNRGGEALRNIKSVRTELTKELGHNPTDEELAERMGMTTTTVTKVLAGEAYVVSYEANLVEDADGEFSLANITADEDENVAEDYAESELMKTLHRVMANCNEEEKKLIQLRFFKDLTIEEVADRMGYGERKIAKAKLAALLVKLRNNEALAAFAN